MKQKYVLGLLVTAMVAAGAATFWQPLKAQDGFIPYWDTTEVARGAEIYSAQCASCHGEELEGAGDWRTPLANGRLPAPPHDETGHTWHHPDPILFQITKFGTAAMVGGTYKSDMQGYSEILSDEEILAVLAFIKSRWPDQLIERHNQITKSALD